MKNSAHNLICWIFVAILSACVCLNIVTIFEMVSNHDLSGLWLPISALVACVLGIIMNVASISND